MTMVTPAPDLPGDVAVLQALLAETRAALAASENALAERSAALAQAEEARRRLELIVLEMRRERFGPRSEKLGRDQLHLPLEDVEVAQGVLDAAQEKAEAALRGARPEHRRPVRRNRGRLPAHLPRIERIIEPASTVCAHGCGPMARPTPRSRLRGDPGGSARTGRSGSTSYRRSSGSSSPSGPATPARRAAPASCRPRHRRT